MTNHNLLDRNDIPSEKVTYHCTKCKKNFVRLEALNLHVIKEHLGHKCYVCDKTFNSVENVARHISTVHSDIESHQCEFCIENFDHFIDMRHHIMNNHSLLDRNDESMEKISYHC